MRLWTEREHAHRPAQELPEVKRLDLAEVVLTLKASGIDDIGGFPWLEKPDPKALERAETLLADLGALGAAATRKGDPTSRSGSEPDREVGPPLGASAGASVAPTKHLSITETGRKMLRFPVHPRYARMFLAAQERGCVRSVALMAALTQGRNFLLRGVPKAVEQAREDLFGEEHESDFFLLMRAWRHADQSNYALEACRRLGLHAQGARQVGPLFRQFLEIAEAEGLDISERKVDGAEVRKCVLAGFSDQLAKRLDAGTLRCELVHQRRGLLARESVIQKSPLLVAAEISEIEGRGGEINVLLSLATAVEEAWLKEIFPDDYRETRGVTYDESTYPVGVQGNLQVLMSPTSAVSTATANGVTANGAQNFSADVQVQAGASITSSFEGVRAFTPGSGAASGGRKHRQVVPVDGLVQVPEAEQPLDLRALVAGDHPQLLRRVGGESARERLARKVQEIHRIAPVKLALHPPHAGGEEALLGLPHRAAGALIHPDPYASRSQISIGTMSQLPIDRQTQPTIDTTTPASIDDHILHAECTYQR